LALQQFCVELLHQLIFGFAFFSIKACEAQVELALSLNAQGLRVMILVMYFY
jgi:hypothetical protein